MLSLAPKSSLEFIPANRQALHLPDKASAAEQQRFRLLATLQGCVLVLVAGVGLTAKAGMFEIGDSPLAMSCLLSTVTAWHFFSLQLAGRKFFEPYALFLLAATLFNAGQGLLETLHLNDSGILDNRFSPDLVIESLYLVTLGLASLQFCALIAFARGGAHQSSRALQTAGACRMKSTATLQVGFGCLAFSVLPFLVVLRDALTIAMTQGYGGLFGREQSDLLPGPVQAMAGFVMPGTMFLIAGSNRKKAPVAIGCSFILIYAGAMLTVGSRAGAVASLVALAWLYERSIRRLPRAFILTASMILLATFPVIAEMRNTPGALGDPVQVLNLVLTYNNPFLAAVREMGGTIITVLHTICLFPSIRSFDLGSSYAYAISTLIPNVGWQVHPAIAHGLLADWLIRTVDPTVARVGGGLGYSFLAEAFANFGWYGIVPVIGAIGYLLTRLFSWGTSDDDPAKLAFTATFLASFLVFARGESATVVRGLVWYALIPYLATSLITRRLSRRR
jgi:oligosaccharide repeat unit polymerase